MSRDAAGAPTNGSARSHVTPFFTRGLGGERGGRKWSLLIISTNCMDRIFINNYDLIKEKMAKHLELWQQHKFVLGENYPRRIC